MQAFRNRRNANSTQTERVRERFSFRKTIAALGTLVKGGNLRLLQRLGLAFLLVTLLGAGTSAAGLWFTNTAAQSVQAVQNASEQIQGIERLQREWFRVVSSVDLLLLTRSLSSMQGELEQNLANFQTQLTSVADQMVQTGHEADIQEAQQIALELDRVMEEFYSLIRAGRWGSAQTVRYTKLSALQTRLEESMSALSQKIQADVQQSMAAAQRTQALARGVWAAAAILALAFSAGISWYSSRAIARPIEELTDTVEKVTAGGVEGALRAIIAPERKDEIGDMWRAFATLTEWLSDAYQTQEKRVEERTRDLERRRLQVQAAAEVARDITGGGEIQDESADALSSLQAGGLQAGHKSSRSMMKILLDKAVDLIRDRFGFYHAGIFLIDDRREYAVLRAATGQAGEQMVAGHHRLKVGQIGLVGFVAETGQPRIALDVDKDAAHFRNPLLPETRSEVALPLRARDQIIGVLDVQSQESAAFDEQDVIILQIIADQLATAIENRRLVNELEIRLQELESFTAGYGRQSWERLAQSGALRGLEYDGESVKPLAQAETFSADAGGAAGFHRFPLKLRDEVIANLDVWPGADGFSSEDIYLLGTFTSRVSQILESARLFNEAQQRAAREQLLNQLTSTIVRSIEPQAVLQAAVQQLENLPSVARATVYLTSPVATELPAERMVQSIAVGGFDRRDDRTTGGLQT